MSPHTYVKNYQTIQALRGIAALAVMLFHFRSAFNLPFFPFGDKLFVGGAVGVTLFFVISGFVMGLPDYSSGIRSASEFAIKRVARIMPLYMIATVVWCYVTIPNFSSLTSLGDIADIGRAMLFYPMNISAAPVYGAKLFVGWTLNYEMLFYGVLAIGILVGRPWIVIAALFGLTLWILPAMRGNFTMNPEVDYGIGFGYLRVASNPVVWNFLAGVAAARLLRMMPAIGRELQFLICVGIALAAGWQFFSGFRSGYGFLQSGIVFAALIFALAWYEKHYSVSVPRSLIFLGNVSFSLYIWHFIVHMWLESFLAEQGLRDYSYGFLYGVTICALSILLARISYILIEQRLSNYVRDALLSVLFGHKMRPSASKV